MIYLTSGFEGPQPDSALGKLIGVVAVILGIGIIGLFTATIASIFVEKTLDRRRGMRPVRSKNHIIICGWNKRARSIIAELHAPNLTHKRDIVVISEDLESVEVDWSDPLFSNVYFVVGDPTSEVVLRKANITEAYAAVVLAECRPGVDTDAQSILKALAIESMSREVHTCVEVIKSENLKHFRHTDVDECISMGRFGELLMAQSAINPGISKFFVELLTNQEEGNEVYMIDVPGAFVGKTFKDLLVRLALEDIIPVGIKSNGRASANPGHDTVLKREDKILVIANQMPDLQALSSEINQ